MASTSTCLALHFQNEVIHPDGAIRVGLTREAPGRARLTQNIARLLERMRADGTAVVSVRIAFLPDHSNVIQNCRLFRDVVRLGAMIDGSWGAGFVEGLGPLPGEHVVTHTRTNAFFGSPLEEVLRCLDTRRLIVAGVSTNSVVEATVRHASDAGYEVTVVADACSAADEELHRASLRNMELIAEVTTTERLLALA